jgi:hypothetical protein
MVVQITIEGIPDDKTFVSSAQLDEQFTDAFYNSGTKHVLKLQERFSAVLRRGATEDIGASGAAAENISSRWQGSVPKWEIAEGSATRANRMIREGIPKGQKVPIEKLRTWAALKGINLVYGNEDEGASPNAVLDRLTSTKGVEFNRSRWFQVGLKTTQSFKPSDVTLKALYAIRYELWRKGTERPTANWYSKLPSGTGRFDYPTYVMTKDGALITDIVQDMGADMIRNIHILSKKGK